jgi:arylsulfatase A-like enzyme
MPSNPNILFLFTDQQSDRALSCSGNPYLNTPHMDTLAESGVRFENSYCAAPVCGPSRACVATGRHPHENGVLVNGMSIHEEMPTMGGVFRNAGYRTAWSGRWCLPGNGPEIRGFDCLHDPIASLMGIHGDAHVADCAIDFLQQKHDRPFLLGVSLCNPHDICYWIMQQSTPQGDLNDGTIRLKKYADTLAFNLSSPDDLPPLPVNFDIDPDEPEFLSKCRQRRYYGQEGTFTWDWNEQKWREYLNAYYRLTELVDIQVGRVTSALQDNGLAENTLVVLTSDHGEGMAGHHWVVKLGLYEEPVKVPLILSWPGIIPSGQIDRKHLASGLDILPTMCDYAGVDCPETTGISLRPSIENPHTPGREFVVSQLHPDTNNLDMQARMVRSSRFKYIRYSEGANPEQLFDLESDPSETRNIVADKDFRHDLEYHRSLLIQACDETHDDFTGA